MLKIWQAVVLAVALATNPSPVQQEGKIDPKLVDVPHLSGYLSGYNQGPTDGTTQYRQEIGDIPRDLTPFDSRIAVLDCSLIGRTGTLYTDAGPLKVVIFDCAGRSDGGNHWMRDNNILAELDWYTWQSHPYLMGTEAKLVLDNGVLSLLYPGLLQLVNTGGKGSFSLPTSRYLQPKGSILLL